MSKPTSNDYKLLAIAIKYRDNQITLMEQDKRMFGNAKAGTSYTLRVLDMLVEEMREEIQQSVDNTHSPR